MNIKIAMTGGFIAGTLIAVSATLIAGSVTIPSSFSGGTIAKASEVNANFNAVAGAVNDNATRITAMESLVHTFGTDNIFVGLNAGNFTMTGSGNTASGASTLSSNTSGGGNTAGGFGALFSNTTGSHNTAYGLSVLGANVDGDDNTAVGSGALFSNTIGSTNTAFGENALVSNTIGNSNTACGAVALNSNTSGSGNIAVGASAGFSLTTGDNNIDIGNSGNAAEGNTIRIGDGQLRAFIAGIRGATTGAADAIAVLVDSNGQLGTASSSRRFKDTITNMGAASNLLMQLRPVTFYYKSDQNPKGRSLQYGLIAEDVAKVAPELVAHSAHGKIETVYYQFLAPMLLNEYQKQQRTIEAQAARIRSLEERLAELAAAVAKLDRAETTIAAR